MATIKKFEDLEIWQLARELCKDIYTIATLTDLKTDFSLRNQINNSSGSVMDNIAEGFGRGGKKEFIQFLSIAKASCEETRSQLYRILDREYITKSKFEELRNQSEVISKRIGAFINYLKQSDFKGTKYKP